MGEIIDQREVSSSSLQVQFVDQGETRELGTNTMRPLHPKFLALPLQAYLCRLDGFDSSFAWSMSDKDLFKKKIRDKILYLKKIRGKRAKKNNDRRRCESISEPNVVQLVDMIDGAMVSFESFWHTLHQTNNKPAEPTKTTSNTSAPVRNLQPLMPSLVGYASGSEYSQTSSIVGKSAPLKKPSGVMIPPPPIPSLTTTSTRPTMQFISAGFKQPTEYTHLSPSEQLAQFQQQEGHRIQPTAGYSINKHFR